MLGWRLELHASGELQLARIGRAIRVGTAGDRTRLIDVDVLASTVRSCPINVIERIEAISPQLECDPLANQEVLLDRDIRIEEVWPVCAVASHIADLIERRD